jgi:hypothetical protein
MERKIREQKSPVPGSVSAAAGQDLFVGEHGAIVADVPKLGLNVHDRRHTGSSEKLQGDTAAKRPAFTRPSYQPPTLSNALI